MAGLAGALEVLARSQKDKYQEINKVCLPPPGAAPDFQRDHPSPQKRRQQFYENVQQDLDSYDLTGGNSPRFPSDVSDGRSDSVSSSQISQDQESQVEDVSTDSKGGGPKRVRFKLFEGKVIDEWKHNRAPVTLYDTEQLALFERKFGFKRRHVKRFAYIFLQLDKDNSLTIDRFELFAWLKENKLGNTLFCGSLFDLVQCKQPGKLDFCEFVTALSTFALFGRDDMLRFCFFALDTDKNGYIDHEELRHLVDMLHGGSENAIYNVDRVLELFDTDGDGVINFDPEFKNINNAHPYLLYPAFRLQARIEHKILGKRFWQRKRAILAKDRRNNKQRLEAQEEEHRGLEEDQRHERIDQSCEDGLNEVHFLSKAQHKGSFSNFVDSAKGSALNLLAFVKPHYKAWLERLEIVYANNTKRDKNTCAIPSCSKSSVDFSRAVHSKRQVFPSSS